MTFDQDAKLFDVLAGGYHLNTQLQALLGRPLDRLGQQEAMAFSQELSQVFKVSMSMLKRNTVTRMKTAPEISRTGNSSGVIIQAAKDKRARSDNGEVVTPAKKGKEEGVTRKETTVSPHKDGYEWRKYGQKNIRNCNFVRYYYRCSRDRRCEAKKKVQQQDCSPGEGPHQLLLPPSSPVFEVTYVNEHTCHALRSNIIASANVDAATMASASPRTTNRSSYRVVDTARDAAVVFDGLSSSFPGIGGGGGSAQDKENETIVSCLANVISGAAEASASDPPAAAYHHHRHHHHHHRHVPAPPMQQQASGHSASVAEDGGSGTRMMMMVVDTEFSWDQSLFCAVGDEGDGQLMTDNERDMMMHVDDAARLPDTVWPRHSPAGAWRWRC